MPTRVTGPTTDSDGLEQLAPLWMELHRHHRDVSEYRALVEDVEASWERRLSWYRRLLDSGACYFTAHSDEGRLVGYAMVAIEKGADDTFDTERGIADVVTLVVTAAHRSAGVGRALLRAAERLARDDGVDTMKIAVMTGNQRAQAFYEDQGYAVAEHVLYRRLGD
jgi:ribosomal protein S18 acetylase RimI-like enzyme